MTKHVITRSICALAASAVAFAGCSSGAGVSNAIPTVSKAHQTASASFTIHWPTAQATSAQRGRHFLSPSAQSVYVLVNPHAPTPGPITYVNRNGNASSTVNFEAPVGTDEFIFVVYDAPQDGSGNYQGQVLGQADVPNQTIVLGKTNNITATIGGVTSHIDVSPVANQPFVESDPNGGFDIVGETPETFVATPYDTDGNVIVGPGSPTISITSPSNGTYMNIQQDATNPNKFTVNTIKAPNTMDPLAVFVKAADSGVNNFTTANVNMWLRSAVYVSYAQGPNSKMMVYDDQGNVIPLPSTAFPGLIAPSGMVYSTAHHQLMVADSSYGGVLAFDTFGNPVANYNVPVLNGAHAVTYDPQSDTYFATGATQVIGFKADGTPATLIASPFANSAKPDAIAYVGVDNKSNPIDSLVVGNDATPSIDYYKPDGTFIRTVSFTPSSKVIAPMSALTWDPGIYGGYLPMAGGPLGATFGQTEAPGGYSSGIQKIWTDSRVGGMTMLSTFYRNTAARGQTNYGLYITRPDQNQIATFIFASDNATSFTYPDVTFTTPASSGMSQPTGIASAL